MGAAAYARGSALIARQIDGDARPVAFVIMDDLNALPKKDKAPTPFGEIQFVAGHGGWWAECPKTGFGYHYKTLREAVRSFRVEVYAYNNGAWLARPMERAS
jgi:hypothetical protein